jgi:hypothetical protein
MTPLIMIVIVAAGLIIIAILVRLDRGPAGSRAVSQAPNSDQSSFSSWHEATPAELECGANIPLEQKLANLAQCGIELAEPLTVEDLLEIDSRDAFETRGYWQLLGLMGGTEEKEPWRRLCNSYYAFDIKCIEDIGYYTEVIESLSALTHGDMVLSEIIEDVAMGKGGPSSISFLCNGKKHFISFEQDWKYFSEIVLNYILRLLRTTGSKRRYFMSAIEDQMVDIGCLFPNQIEQLKQLGLKLIVI